MSHVHQSQQKNAFVIPFILIFVFAIVEFLGGVWTQSLALLGDAWHMFSDVLALGLAMIAAHRANQARRKQQQSRAELIASILNVLLMLAVTGWIVIEAIERLSNPRPVAGVFVMLIAFVGLVVNLFVAKQLHQGDDHKGLNHQAALLHVFGDILGSLAALLAGLIIYFTGWVHIDAILSLFISLLLLIGTGALARKIWLNFTDRMTR